MKPHWLITLSLTLMLAMACSKDEEATEEAPDSGEPAAPPAENTEHITPSAADDQRLGVDSGVRLPRI